MTMAMAAARLRLGSLLPRARALCAEAKPTYTQRMDATGRPVSPHLMIYRLPTIAYSSITVRISGIIAGAGVLGAGVVSLYGSDTAQDTMISVGNGPYGSVARFAVAWPLVYHWLGNIRHIYWDMTAKGFNNATMLKTSYALFGATTLISLGLGVMTLPAPQKKK